MTTHIEESGISVMTLAELRYGANCFAKPESNHIAIDNFTSSIPVVGIDQNVARIFADIKAQLRKEGTAH